MSRPLSHTYTHRLLPCSPYAWAIGCKRTTQSTDTPDITQPRFRASSPHDTPISYCTAAALWRKPTPPTLGDQAREYMFSMQRSNNQHLYACKTPPPGWVAVRHPAADCHSPARPPPRRCSPAMALRKIKPALSAPPPLPRLLLPAASAGRLATVPWGSASANPPRAGYL